MHHRIFKNESNNETVVVSSDYFSSSKRVKVLAPRNLNILISYVDLWFFYLVLYMYVTSFFLQTEK